MSLKRKIKRALEEIKATIKIAKVTSFSEALNTFRGKIEIQKMVKNGYQETPKAKKILMNKHETMIKYFELTFDGFLKNYNYNKEEDIVDSKFFNNIWVCWWQGLDNAPDIVKACILSVKRNAGNHNVIVVTLDNYDKYINLPKWVKEKIDKKIISLTHFSDILRLALLSKYGGLWLDATLYCNDSLENIFYNKIWSIKRPDYLHCSIASGNFATYALYSNVNYRFIFKTIYDFFLYYWEKNNFLVDYLTLDYMIVLAQKNNKLIKQAFDEILQNNSHCDDLCYLLNKEYNDKIWNDITKDTYLFKLTWKTKFDYGNTFYRKILNNELQRGKNL